MHENALNPIVFPALRRFETETAAMAADMLNGDANVVGSLTSGSFPRQTCTKKFDIYSFSKGGTESILMAIKTYRDRARSLFPHIKSPEMVNRPREGAENFLKYDLGCAHHDSPGFRKSGSLFRRENRSRPTRFRLQTESRQISPGASNK